MPITDRGRRARGRALVEELLRQKNVQPIQSAADPDGRDIFETDELREHSPQDQICLYGDTWVTKFAPELAPNCP